MEQIKKRIYAIDTILEEKCTTAYPATNTEFLCLQIRKILEHIALASIAANKEEYAKQYNKFFKHWNAKRILKDLEKINPSFYPVPGSQIIDPDTGRPIGLNILTNGFLTKEEFPSVYNKCSEIIHSSNPYGFIISYEDFDKLIPEWTKKIKRLLSHHQIQLIDNQYQLWVLMESKDDGKVKTSIFQKIDK